MNSKIQLTPKEESDLDQAISKALDAFQEIEKVLARIGGRLDLRWGNTRHMADMLGFLAHNHSDRPSMHFVNKAFWIEGSS
jgi:hypothetical protein